MKARALRLLAALCVLALGCGDSSVSFDAGSGSDAGTDVGIDAFVPADAGRDGGRDAGAVDADLRLDAGPDADFDAGTDGGVDAGVDAGTDAGTDAGVDGGTDAGPMGVIAGTLLYEDRPQDLAGFTGAVVETPAHGFRVQLLFDGDVVEETRTDATGAFAFVGRGHEVQALSDAEFDGHRVQVVTRSARPRLYGLLAAATPGDPMRLLARSDRSEGGAFNIAAVAREAFEFYAPYVGAAAPTLTYRWERGRAFGCGSCYGGDVVSLGGGEDDTDEYDDVIILHELGHYFVDHYSHDDSPGGSHRDRQVSPVLAYGEGLGYAFAQFVRNEPFTIDTFIADVRSIDAELMTIGGVEIAEFSGTTTGTLSGNLREEIVNGILWDAFDEPSADEPFDRVALGVDGMMTLLVDHFGGPLPPNQGAAGLDLADLLYAFVCFSGVPAEDAQALADDRAFPWTAPTVCD